MKTCPFIVVIALAVALAACSGAPGEETMAIAPGRYSILVDGKPVRLPNEKTICIASGTDEATIDKLVRMPFAKFPYCTHDPDKAVGNQISGDLTCNANVAIGTVVDYTGTIATDAISIDTVMKPMPLDKSTHRTFTVRAKRTGPC